MHFMGRFVVTLLKICFVWLSHVFDNIQKFILSIANAMHLLSGQIWSRALELQWTYKKLCWSKQSLATKITSDNEREEILILKPSEGNTRKLQTYKVHRTEA